MTKKYSRAQRRADYARIKKKRQFHWGYGHKEGWGRDSGRGEICFMKPAQAGLVARTATPCSCWMCGNPRRGAADNGFGRLTKKEVEAIDSFNDGMEDYQLAFDDYDWWYDDGGYDNEGHFELITWKWAKARGWID